MSGIPIASSVKREYQVDRFVTLSTDRDFVICKTVITTSMPVDSFEKVLGSRSLYSIFPEIKNAGKGEGE